MLRAIAIIGVAWAVNGLAGEPSKHDLDASATFFKDSRIPHIKLKLSNESIEKLKAEPREWVQASFTENGQADFDSVWIKLKGMAGSFRPIDDAKPAFSIKSDKLHFHGLAKFHLNNSVQDRTYLHELLSSEICEAAGVLTPRTTHARVWLNGRDLGLYVLKEGFDSHLLQRKFKDTSGKLYDSGFLQDIDGPLKESNGKGDDKRAELTALVKCCQLPDLADRWKKLPDLLDIDAFITFMAAETMLVHWDGYCYSRNNYRLYLDPKSKKAYFLPHGMDQMFADPNATVLAMPTSMVAGTVMSNPEWRANYREKVRQLTPLFDAAKLRRRINEVARQLEPELKAIDEGFAKEHARTVAALKNNLRRREKSLKTQNEMPDPKMYDFPPGQKRIIDDWRNESESEDAHHAAVDDQLLIRCGPSRHCVASWRKRIALPKGNYHFEATVAVNEVAELKEPAPAKGIGAGIRVSGAERKQGFTGTRVENACLYEFEVKEAFAIVDLIAELRAAKGEARFVAKSMTLTRR